MCHKFDRYPQLLENVRYRGGAPLEAAAVQKAIAAGEEKLGSTGRLVIRPSGTEPLIRVMGESDNDVLLQGVIGDIVSAIETVTA